LIDAIEYFLKRSQSGINSLSFAAIDHRTQRFDVPSIASEFHSHHPGSNTLTLHMPILRQRVLNQDGLDGKKDGQDGG
jgi:hypothetical protein